MGLNNILRNLISPYLLTCSARLDLLLCTSCTPFNLHGCPCRTFYGSEPTSPPTPPPPHTHTKSVKTDLRSRGTVVAFGAVPLDGGAARLGAVGSRDTRRALALEPEPCLRAVRAYKKDVTNDVERHVRVGLGLHFWSWGTVGIRVRFRVWGMRTPGVRRECCV